ncbi:hypothetical protein LguiA_008222 [Lonicera macranthoides]
MALFSTTASKPIMLFLLEAIIFLVLLFSSHNSVAQARVELELSGEVVDELANGLARIGHKMLWNAAERTTLTFFGENAQKGFLHGKKVSKYINKMKDIASQQCNSTTFCVTLDQQCEPCSLNSQFNQHCPPYCVLKWVDNSTASCILPCGPPANYGNVSPSPSQSAALQQTTVMSLQVLLLVLNMVVATKW